MFANLTFKATQMATLLQGGGAGSLTNLAETIQNLLLQAAGVIGLPLLLIGFAMMMFGGISPQWKQRGIETLKWTIIGEIGLLVGAGALWAFIQTAVGTGGGGM